MKQLLYEQRFDPTLYWSSTKSELHKNAFCLDFSNGKVFRFIKNHSMHVRPVRKMWKTLRP